MPESGILALTVMVPPNSSAHEGNSIQRTEAEGPVVERQVSPSSPWKVQTVAAGAGAALPVSRSTTSAVKVVLSPSRRCWMSGSMRTATARTWATDAIPRKQQNNPIVDTRIQNLPLAYPSRPDGQTDG